MAASAYDWTTRGGSATGSRRPFASAAQESLQW